MDLKDLYAEAWDDNVFFVEYSGMPAAAGDRRDLVALAIENNTTPEKLLAEFTSSFMGAIVDLCILGEVKGDNRVENCQSAWDEFKKYREKGVFPKVVAVREELGMEIGDTHKLGTF